MDLWDPTQPSPVRIFLYDKKALLWTKVKEGFVLKVKSGEHVYLRALGCHTPLMFDDYRSKEMDQSGEK